MSYNKPRTTEGMLVCPRCLGRKIGVIDSRSRGVGIIRRRRQCVDCNHRWTTAEVPAEGIERLPILLTAARKALAELQTLVSALEVITLPPEPTEDDNSPTG